VLDLFADDEHVVLLLPHEFDRGAKHRQNRIAHTIQLRGAPIAGRGRHEFEEAWGTR
jgi:hypothetical protein